MSDTSPTTPSFVPATPSPTAPPTSAPSPRRRSPIKVILLGVLVVAVLVGATLGGMAAWRSVQERAAQEALEREGTAAVQTVEGYLDALVRRDVAAALSYGETTIVDGDLLTDAVAGPALEAAPITDVVVGTPTLTRDAQGAFTTAEVGVTYRMDGTPVVRTWNLVRVGAAWKLPATTARLTVSRTDHTFSVAGVEIGSGGVDVLPGRYTVTASSKVLQLDEPQVTVLAPGEEKSVVTTLAPKPSVLAAAGDAIRSAFDRCVSADSPEPDGCWFKLLAPAGKIVPGTLEISAEGVPFADPHLSLVDEVTYYARAEVVWRAVAEIEGGLTLEWGPTRSSVMARVNLETLAVTFSAD